MQIWVYVNLSSHIHVLRVNYYIKNLLVWTEWLLIGGWHQILGEIPWPVQSRALEGWGVHQLQHAWKWEESGYSKSNRILLTEKLCIALPIPGVGNQVPWHQIEHSVSPQPDYRVTVFTLMSFRKSTVTVIV